MYNNALRSVPAASECVEVGSELKPENYHLLKGDLTLED